MCVCNFLINGCVGEVVCIDSLRMDNFRGAWIVNEALCRTGLPTVRKLDQKEYNLFKQSDIPPYVFFINQEGYDDYFRTRETWAKVMSLFHEPPTTQSAYVSQRSNHHRRAAGIQGFHPTAFQPSRGRQLPLGTLLLHLFLYRLPCVRCSFHDMERRTRKRCTL